MNKLIVGLCALLATAGVGVAKESDDQAKIGKILQDIVDAAQKKELDRLDAFHDYGPKFSKFEDDGLGRQDAATGKKGERDALSAVKAFNAKINDLKVDIFGNTAVATMILAYDIDMGKEKMAGKDRSTLVFVKQGGTWKIVHEHSSPLK
jgi:ketosteroid isomerase-like protein